MPYTIAQILQVVTPTVMAELGKEYVLGNIAAERNHAGYRATLYSPRHRAYTAFAWSRESEVALTEAGRITLAKSLLHHAIGELDRFVADERERLPFHAPPPTDDPAIDVDFS